jgi:hypothetical protein
MNMVKLLRGLLPALSLLFPLTQAWPANMPPGTTGATPDLLTVSPSAILLTSFSSSLNSGTFTASYTTWVFRDPTNQFGANDLDFLIQLTDNGAVNGSGGASGIIEHITASSYSGFLTDIGINLGGAPGVSASGTSIPNTVDHSLGGNGDVVTWDFTGLGSNSLNGGNTTVLLEVQTNAASFRPGSIGAIDGSGAFGGGFAPAVPEPGSMALFGLGAIAIFSAMFVRRQARR